MISYQDILNIGQTLSSIKCIQTHNFSSQFIIELNEDDFKKIDEDLFYRQHIEDVDFIPSDNTITVAFDNFMIIIKKR